MSYFFICFDDLLFDAVGRRGEVVVELFCHFWVFEVFFFKCASVFFGVGMQRKIVYIITCYLKKCLVPARVLPVSAAAGHKLYVFVNGAHSFAKFDTFSCVGFLIDVSGFPIAEEFISKSPDFYIVRLGMAVLCAEFSELCVE
ncbi:hypothetical protein ES703_101015 [subsurface metagenome]